jgi:hypothetical protein
MKPHGDDSYAGGTIWDPEKDKTQVENDGQGRRPMSRLHLFRLLGEIKG